MSAVFRKVPVFAYAQFAVLKFQQVAGRQFVYFRKRRRRIRHVSQVHVLHECCAVHFRQLRCNRENGFNLRREIKFSVVKCVVQRLFAETVARDQQRLPAIIPKRECEHASQLLHTISAHFLVKMDNSFCITVRGKMMSVRLQLGAEFWKVVDFTVENNPG